MRDKFNPNAAAGLDLVYGFRITDEDKDFALVVKDGTCGLQESKHPDANVTLVLDSETFRAIVSGETDGMQAFMGGKMRVEGDMSLATRLPQLFPA
jgi:putative sterol carrier protein